MTHRTYQALLGCSIATESAIQHLRLGGLHTAPRLRAQCGAVCASKRTATAPRKRDPSCQVRSAEVEVGEERNKDASAHAKEAWEVAWRRVLDTVRSRCTRKLRSPPNPLKDDQRLLATLDPELAARRADLLLSLLLPDATDDASSHATSSGAALKPDDLASIMLARPGAWLAAEPQEVLTRLIGLSTALESSVDELLRGAAQDEKGLRLLLRLEPQAVALRCKELQAATDKHLHAKEPRTLAPAMLRHRLSLMQLDAKALEERLEMLEACKDASEIATRLSKQRYDGDAAAEELAAWLASDDHKVLRMRFAVEHPKEWGQRRDPFEDQLSVPKAYIRYVGVEEKKKRLRALGKPRVRDRVHEETDC